MSKPSNIFPRFVAVDLDGTVLPDDKILSERTLAAFEALRSRGIVPLIATGRPRRSTLPWALKLGVSAGLVCHNGAIVYDAEGRLLAESTIPEATARRIVELARTFPTHFHGFVGDEWLYEKRHPGTARYEYRSGFQGRQVDFDLLPRLGFHKAMFITTEEEAPALGEKLRKALGDGIEIYLGGSGFLELVAPGIGKGKSLAILVESLGGNMAEVLAFGDAWNDEDLLLRAGVGVAMGNAPAGLRERVGRVTLSIGDDGVAAWLEKLLLTPS